MAFNLLDTIRGYLTPDLLSKAGEQLGESSSGMTKAVTAAVPAVLATFVNRTEEGDAHGLLNEAREAADSNVTGDPQRLFNAGNGSVFPGGWDRIKNMLGEKATPLISSIAGFAGIKAGSVQRLLGMLTPLSLGVLGNHARENNLSAQGLTSLLADQKSAIMGALPAGFSPGNLFQGASAKFASATTAVHSGQLETGHRVRSTRWMPWLLLAFAAIATLVWFWNRREKPIVQGKTITTPATVSPAPTTATTREYTNVRLANGVEINAYKGGVEDQLVACLHNPGCTAGSDKWFDFDNLNFESGSARLTAASQEQVNNIAAILKAYPKTKIKIGGYTDKTGSDAANLTLSQQRADVVMNAIKTAGANRTQLVGAEGYGSKFAKAVATATEDERRKDRRIAISLREK